MTVSCRTVDVIRSASHRFTRVTDAFIKKNGESRMGFVVICPICSSKNIKYQKKWKLTRLITYLTIKSLLSRTPAGSLGGSGERESFVRDSSSFLSLINSKTSELPKPTIFKEQPFTPTFTLSTHLQAIIMKLHILLLITLVVSIFLSAEGSLRGLEGNKNIFDSEKEGRGSSSTPEEEHTATTPTPEEPITSVITAAAAADNVANDEYIEVDVAITYDSVSHEEQRQVSIILMETLNELGIGPLTDGAAPFEAVMTLNSFSIEETEDEAFRRRLGTYSRYIGPCRRCPTSRRRGLKKSSNIKKTLEDKLNKAIQEQGIKLKVKIDDVQYFSFEKPSA